MNTYKLNKQNLTAISNKVATPKYSRDNVKAGILHVGIGCFHRAHEAYYTDLLLQEKDASEWGICGVALLDFDAKIYQTLKEQDGLYTLIVKELDGTLTKKVIGSIVEYLYAPENPLQVIEKMADEAIKIITLTITEGGYNYNEATGAFDFNNSLIQFDLKNPETPKTIFGYLTQALKLRKERGLLGFTLQSCDNIQGNGHMAKKMLLSYVAVAEPNLVSWIETNVSFPNSMVDRITPATSPTDITDLEKSSGIIDSWPVVCEPYIQWVIEDNFIAGRPNWENVGAQFVEDVLPFEKMKLALLNAGHSVLGILGALIGYKTIDEAVHNPNISKFLSLYMDFEVTPTLKDLKGVNLKAYKESLIQRFGNIYIKDQIDRICSETAAKLPIFILPTVKTQLATKNNTVDLAAFVVAAWAIYSLGLDEKGNDLTIRDVLKFVLNEKAIEAQTNPVAFLELTTVFGDLHTSKIFTDAYIKAYESITKNGVEKSLQEINNNY